MGGTTLLREERHYCAKSDNPTRSVGVPFFGVRGEAGGHMDTPIAALGQAAIEAAEAEAALAEAERSRLERQAAEEARRRGIQVWRAQAFCH